MREHELWKKVNGFPEYFISTHGHFRSLKTGKLKDIRPRKSGVGYLYVSLSQDGKQHQKAVHQLVYSHFIGELSCGLEVNHKDLNKENNHYQNLELLSHQENVKHAFKIIMHRRYRQRFEC